MVVIQLIFIEITGTALLWLKNFFELRPVFENYGDQRLCVIILYNFTRQIWRRWGNTTRLYLLFDVSTSITGIRQKKLVLVLSVLDRTRTCRVKKAVICVTELMAALIPICDLLLLLLSLDDTLICVLSVQLLKKVEALKEQLEQVQEREQRSVAEKAIQDVVCVPFFWVYWILVVLESTFLSIRVTLGDGRRNQRSEAHVLGVELVCCRITATHNLQARCPFKSSEHWTVLKFKVIVVIQH